MPACNIKHFIFHHRAKTNQDTHQIKPQKCTQALRTTYVNRMPIPHATRYPFMQKTLDTQNIQPNIPVYSRQLRKRKLPCRQHPSLPFITNASQDNAIESSYAHMNRTSINAHLMRPPAPLHTIATSTSLVGTNENSLIPHHEKNLQFDSTHQSKMIKTLSKLKLKYINESVDPCSAKPHLRERVIKIITKLKQLNLQPEDICSKEVISHMPYQKGFSKELIMAAKEGDANIVMKYLKVNKYLVYDFDFSNKTALHWATMRGHHHIMVILLQWHADVDAQDIHRKTPLHYATQLGDIIGCKILLASEADPFIHCNLGLEPMDFTTNERILMLYKRVRKINVISQWFSCKVKRDNMRKLLKEINDTEYVL